MFKALIGDLLASDAQTLVNTVNCVGVMGKGVALEFKKRYPTMFDDYVTRCGHHQVRLGEPYPFRLSNGNVVVNFPTKDHWRSPSRLRDIERGLDYLAAHYRQWGLKSIALPPLGCGNGGLHWSDVGPLMYAKLHALPIKIEVFAPYGTPVTQLTKGFLARPTQMSLDDRGRQRERFNSEWIPLMEVLRDIGQQPYAHPVGRTIFQKICYVLTEMGVQTGFQFNKGSYGPFADEVKAALGEFANRNWLQEEKLGSMLALRVGAQYEKDRLRFAEVLRHHERRVNKAVDLFSRIKSTDQAEEVLTVLFASRQLKKAHPSREIAEQELLDFILSWKKRWASQEKREALTGAIQNLVALGWMKLTLSETATEPV